MGITYTSLDTTKLSTAEIYAKVLCDLAEDDERIVAITADLAKSTKIGAFHERFPERFYNVGIAEQNMFGIAAGMAKCGLIPFTATFAIFNSCRGLDQVHTDICYQNLNVKMLGTHAGTSFGQAGTTHHSTEDIAIMRSMANLTVIVPADGTETANVVKAAIEHEGPMYIRINRGFDQVVYDSMDYDFQIGKAVTLNEGSDLTIIACGSAVFSALQAAREIEAQSGIKARVLDMHTIKPLDVVAIDKVCACTKLIVTVEEHSIIGGLGSAVAEYIVNKNTRVPQLMIGINDFFPYAGDYRYLLEQCGLTAPQIAEKIKEKYNLL